MYYRVLLFIIPNKITVSPDNMKYLFAFIWHVMFCLQDQTKAFHKIRLKKCRDTWLEKKHRWLTEALTP